MSKHRHLPLIVGFLMMAASAGGRSGQHGQAGRAGRAAPVRRPDVPGMVARSRMQTDDVKRIKVCRVETVCKMRFKEGQTPRTRVRNLVAAAAVRGRDHSHLRSLHQTGPAGAGQPAGQAGRDGPVHRLHRRRAADRPRREHLRKPPVVVEGTGRTASRWPCRQPWDCRPRRSKATVAAPRTRSPPTTPRRDGR